MQLPIIELVLNFVFRINPKCIRYRFASIELFQSIFNVFRITDFYILRKRWICKDIDYSGIFAVLLYRTPFINFQQLSHHCATFALHYQK